MSRLEEFSALRKQGLTYRQIADRYGCSHQNVAKILATRSLARFRGYDEKECVYPGLRTWLNESKTCRVEIINILDGSRNPNTARRKKLREQLRGHCGFTQSDIEKLLSASGLTYEQLFHGADKLVRCHECIHKMKRDLFNHTVYECSCTELQITNMNGFCDKGKRA